MLLRRLSEQSTECSPIQFPAQIEPRELPTSMRSASTKGKKALLIGSFRSPLSLLSLLSVALNLSVHGAAYPAHKDGSGAVRAAKVSVAARVFHRCSSL